MLDIAILSDSNSRLGEGHCIRCLRLASHLISIGWHVNWFSMELTDRVALEISKENIIINKINDINDLSNFEISIMIIDGYEYDLHHIRSILNEDVKLICFDDLADRTLPVDMVIDANPVKDRSSYDDLVPVRCKKLIGSEFLIFSNDYSSKSRIIIEKKIHIFFGSTDSFGYTYLYLKKLVRLLPKYSFNVVVTSETKNIVEILGFCRFYNNINIYFEPSSLKDSLEGCRFSVGGPGTSTWERLYMGTRCLLMSTVFNQHKILKELEEHNLIRYIGEAANIDSIIMKLVKIIKNNQSFKENRINFDGLGKIRIANEIMGLVDENI